MIAAMTSLRVDMSKKVAGAAAAAAAAVFLLQTGRKVVRKHQD